MTSAGHDRRAPRVAQGPAARGGFRDRPAALAGTPALGRGQSPWHLWQSGFRKEEWTPAPELAHQRFPTARGSARGPATAESAIRRLAGCRRRLPSAAHVVTLGGHPSPFPRAPEPCLPNARHSIRALDNSSRSASLQRGGGGGGGWTAPAGWAQTGCGRRKGHHERTGSDCFAGSGWGKSGTSGKPIAAHQRGATGEPTRAGAQGPRVSQWRGPVAWQWHLPELSRAGRSGLGPRPPSPSCPPDRRSHLAQSTTAAPSCSTRPLSSGRRIGRGPRRSSGRSRRGASPEP